MIIYIMNYVSIPEEHPNPVLSLEFTVGEFCDDTKTNYDFREIVCKDCGICVTRKNCKKLFKGYIKTIKEKEKQHIYDINLIIIYYRPLDIQNSLNNIGFKNKYNELKNKTQWT